MKNVLFTIVALLLPEVIMATGDYHVYGTKIGSIYYHLNSSNKTASVTCKYYEEEMNRFYACENDYIGAIVIPQKVTHEDIVYPVTSIGQYAFYGCSGLTSINIPNSVTSIGSYAFSGCSGLTTIVSEIENPFSIDKSVFNGIDSNVPLIVPKGKRSVYQSTEGWKQFTNILEVGEFEVNGIRYLIGENNTVSVISKSTKYSGDVVIPGQVTYNGKTYSVTSIGISAFYNCNSLTSVTIPNSVTSIGYSAFEGCNSLTSVTIPNGVTRIDEDTFSDCRSLTSIFIPSSVTYIDCGAFRNCSSLTSVHISDLAAWCKISFFCMYANPLTYADHLFLNGEEIKNLTIPSNVTSIGDQAFFGCSGLTSVTIPSSVTSIGDYAFSSCTGLTTIVSEIENPFSIDNSVFNGIDSNILLIVPKGKRSVYQSTEGWKQFTNILEVGEFEVNGIRYLIGENNTVSVISKSTKYSGDVVIPGQVTYNGKTYSVTSIGISAFYNCNSLTSVTIPNSVTSIGYSAFEGCNSLTSVTIPNSMKRIKEDAFSGCSALTSVHISDLAAWCQISCDLCNSDTYTSNPLHYAHHLFLNGVEIKEIIIPNSVQSIGQGAFDGCSYMTSITIHNKVNSIGACAFSGCSGLTTITIPQNVTSIKRATFYSCTGLSSINIPNSVTSIGDYAFDYRNNLTEVYCLAEQVPDTKSNSFSTNIGNATLHVPATSINAYKNASPWNQFRAIVPTGNTLFKLIYKVDDVEYKTYDVEYGTSITPEPAPTKEGYTFSGWSEIPEKMPAKDVTVTGTFTINKYKLIYKVDDVEYKTCDVEYGTTITPEPVPTKEGYTFSGWSEIPEKMPAKDVTVLGSFSKGAYKLTYMVDGKVYKTINYDYGATITPEAEPTKDGYTFSGWSSIPETMPAKDVTVTGSFSKGAYKLTYMVDGKVYKTISYDYGATITPEAKPTKEGYTFSGWSEIPSTMPAKDVTVTGTFTINKYKLVYIVDGVEYKSYDVEYGAKITPEAEPTKEGYTFSGWSSIPEAMPAKDVTITGTFTINKYKLNYLVDGEKYKSFELDYGTTITPETAPTKKGYTFSGWSEIPEKMPAKDVTVTGSFTINKYKLTYKVDDVEYKTYDVEYGTAITPEPAPTKEGYTFSGWSEIPEKMPAKDVTIVGTFSKLKYKLTYIVDGEIYKSYEIKPGSTIIPEVEPTKEGFTFSGWSEIPEEMPAKDVTVTGTFTKDIKKGDINGDNTVNGKDIDEIVNYLMGKPSNSFDIKAADVNGDEKVNAADIVTIVKIIKGNQ